MKQTQQISSQQTSFHAGGWVGIDVSKDTLDAALSLPSGPSYSMVAGHFPNDKKGLALC